MTDQTRNRLLVLGIGNEILSDDAIGPKLVKDLSKDFDGAGIDFLSCSLGGLDVLEIIRDYESAILIDAIKTRGGIPGAVYLFEPSDFQETLHLSNLHDIDFLTALKLGETLKMNVPSRIHIVAIEIIEDLIFSNDFTEPVQKRYPSILKELKEFIKEEFISDSASPPAPLLCS